MMRLNHDRYCAYASDIGSARFVLNTCWSRELNAIESKDLSIFWVCSLAGRVVILKIFYPFILFYEVSKFTSECILFDKM